MGQKEIVGLKMFWPQKNSSLNKFCVQKYLESKQLGVQKNIGEKYLSTKKIDQNYLGSKKFTIKNVLAW